jgi:hypothetical protein
MHLHLWQGVTIPERCQLQGRTTTSSSSKTELRRDGEQWVLEITQANRSPWIQSRLRLDKNGRIIERRDFNASHELINLHSVRWDETGNLLEHTNRRFYKGKERTHQTLTQRWKEGLLVERRLEDKLNGTVDRLQSWTYNERKQLLSATYRLERNRPQTWSVVWTYKQGVLPTSMLLKLDDKLHSLERWEWSEGTQPLLRKRSVTLVQSAQPPLDHLFVYPGVNVARAKGSTCRPITAGWGSGYSGAAYTLGHNETKQKPGLLLGPVGDFRQVYGWPLNGAGHQQYGQVYALMFFFQQHTLHQQYNPQNFPNQRRQPMNLPGYGHFGFREPRLLFARFGKEEGMSMEVVFDKDGKLVEEKAWRSRLDKNGRVEQKEATLVFTRQRTLEGEQLKDDRLFLWKEGRKLYERRLRFLYDEKGRLKRRELWHNQRLLEFQNWQRTAQGYLSFVSFGGQSRKEEQKLSSWEHQTSQNKPLELATPTIQVNVTLTYDDKGQLSNEKLVWLGEDNYGQVQRQVIFSGKNVKETIALTQRNRRYNITTIRDNHGRVLEETQDSDGNGRWEQKNEYSYNTQGALLSHRVFSRSTKGGTSTRSSTNFRWQCQ